MPRERYTNMPDFIGGRDSNGEPYTFSGEFSSLFSCSLLSSRCRRGGLHERGVRARGGRRHAAGRLRAVLLPVALPRLQGRPRAEPGAGRARRLRAPPRAGRGGGAPQRALPQRAAVVPRVAGEVRDAAGGPPVRGREGVGPVRRLPQPPLHQHPRPGGREARAARARRHVRPRARAARPAAASRRPLADQRAGGTHAAGRVPARGHVRGAAHGEPHEGALLPLAAPRRRPQHSQ